MGSIIFNNKNSSENNVTNELGLIISFSGVGCTTVFGAEEAALAACKILAQSNHTVFSKILARQTVNVVKILVL